MYTRVARAGLLLALALLSLPAIAHAQFVSPDYEINEIFIGGGGELEACGTDYCSRQTLGETAVGATGSNDFSAQAGFNTTDTEVLEVSVSNTSIDLGVLNTSSTAAASANFSVKNYLSNGYIVRIYGDPPTNHTGPGTASLDPLNSPSLSQTATEQFGINLVANTNPGIGIDPKHVPGPDDPEYLAPPFGFGYAAAGYDTEDYFKYVDGDVVAQSDSSSGQTNFTISMIANVATSTPGGQYVTTLVVQAIATF